MAATSRSPSLQTAITGPPRALISCMLDITLSKTLPRGTRNTLGVSASTKAIGPCFISAGIALAMASDLLQHEVGEVPLLGLEVAEVMVDVFHRHVDGVEIHVADDPALAVELADLPVVEVNHFVGVTRERVGVGSQVVAVGAEADDERATEAGAQRV